MIVGSMSYIISCIFHELIQRMTCSLISESEDFPRDDIGSTSAVILLLHDNACVDATFDSELTLVDAGRHNIVVVFVW